MNAIDCLVQVENMINRRRLTEHWRCVIAEQEAFCPGRCGKRDICKNFNIILETLQDAYFDPRNKYNHQPVLWKAF